MIPNIDDFTKIGLGGVSLWAFVVSVRLIVTLLNSRQKPTYNRDRIAIVLTIAAVLVAALGLLATVLLGQHPQ